MKLLTEIKDEIAKLVGHAEPEVKAAAQAVDAKIDTLKSEFEAEITRLEDEIAALTAKLAKDAETAAGPVLAEAVKDAEVAADVAKGA